MAESKFDSNGIESIRAAFIEANVATLSTFDLSYNPAYFDTDAKCAAWAAVLRTLPGLR